MKCSCLEPDCAAQQKQQSQGMAENSETKPETASSLRNDLHQRVEQLRDKTSRLSETLDGIEDTLKEAARESED
jgi:septal ring factor EnvC (AmiA/AmiB activator)